MRREKPGDAWERRLAGVLEWKRTWPPPTPQEILAVDEALAKLESVHRPAAELVKLRYFAGMTIPEAADALAISARKANQLWAYARAWLLAELHLTVPE